MLYHSYHQGFETNYVNLSARIAINDTPKKEMSKAQYLLCHRKMYAGIFNLFFHGNGLVKRRGNAMI